MSLKVSPFNDFMFTHKHFFEEKLVNDPQIDNYTAKTLRQKANS